MVPTGPKRSQHSRGSPSFPTCVKRVSGAAAIIRSMTARLIIVKPAPAPETWIRPVPTSQGTLPSGSGTRQKFHRSSGTFCR